MSAKPSPAPVKPEKLHPLHAARRAGVPLLAIETSDPAQTIAAVKAALHRHLADLQALSPEELLNQRYERYRHLGLYEEAGVMKS